MSSVQHDHFSVGSAADLYVTTRRNGLKSVREGAKKFNIAFPFPSQALDFVVLLNVADNRRPNHRDLPSRRTKSERQKCVHRLSSPYREQQDAFCWFGISTAFVKY